MQQALCWCGEHLQAGGGRRQSKRSSAGMLTTNSARPYLSPKGKSQKSTSALERKQHFNGIGSPVAALMTRPCVCLRFPIRWLAELQATKDQLEMQYLEVCLVDDS